MIDCFKVELENTLEQEQEALVNRLWKRMDKLEAEKRSLQIRLDQPVSDPASPRYNKVLLTFKQSSNCTCAFKYENGLPKRNPTS